MTFDRINFEALEQELIGLRRELHTYPELGFTEYRTTVRIMEELTKLGIPCTYGRTLHTTGERPRAPGADYDKECVDRAIAETGEAAIIGEMAGGYTGVIGVIEGRKPGPVTAVRVDIDCMPVPEDMSADRLPVKAGFASRHDGLMHACGHDGHTAIGLGVARILAEYREELPGRVLLIFQPAEERTGALSLVDAGVLRDVDYIFGGHIAGEDMALGQVSSSVYGMPIARKVELTFEGKAAHSGHTPQKGCNALAAAATAALGILGIARHSEGYSRVNVGEMHAGTASNVIPGHARLSCEVRGQTEAITDYMYNRMVEVGQGAAAMYGCTLICNLLGQSNDAVCDEAVMRAVFAAAAEDPAITETLPAADFRGAGDDFVFMMRDVQSRGGKASYLFLGASAQAPHHNSRFDFDERVIPLAARLFAGTVFKIAEGHAANG